MSIGVRMTGKARRDAIITTAIGMFSERGFRGVTTRELSAAVGVSEPVLYQHFPSKRDLYAAIIERKIEQSASLRERFAALCKHPGKPEDFFEHLGLIVIEWHRADPTFLRLFLRSSLENDELRDVCRKRMLGDYFVPLVDAVARLGKSAGFRPMDPATVAYAYFAALTMHCLDRILFSHPLEDISDEEMVKTVAKIFLNGLKKEKKK